jgi:hypothetical protein
MKILKHDFLAVGYKKRSVQPEAMGSGYLHMNREQTSASVIVNSLAPFVAPTLEFSVYLPLTAVSFPLSDSQAKSHEEVTELCIEFYCGPFSIH